MMKIMMVITINRLLDVFESVWHGMVQFVKYNSMFRALQCSKPFIYVNLNMIWEPRKLYANVHCSGKHIICTYLGIV